MDKYKVIAEKITYSLDGYIADHNNRNFGDADGWLRHVRNGWEEFIEAHPDSLNLHEYLQYQQAKVEELQKRVEAALLIANKNIEQCRVTEKRRDFPLWMQNQAFVIRELMQELEQALKGEE